MKTVYSILLANLFFIATSWSQQPVLVNTTADKGINYVILDAASWGTDIDRALGRNEEHASLFYLKGVDHELESVAPYLFKYPDDPKERKSFDSWLVRNYNDTHRAFYLHSDSSLEELRKHLAVFTRARTESGKSLFFRFYDPAVAPYMFQMLTDKQAAMFFEKVNYIAYTDPRTDKDMILAPSATVLEYAKGNTLPKGEIIVISEDQMEKISNAMQQYNSIEPVVVTYNLSGRAVDGELPLPVFDKQSNARVMVEITVNREGKVTKATTIQQGTLLSMHIKKVAEEAALKTVFGADSDAPASQKGNIIYRFDKL